MSETVKIERANWDNEPYSYIFADVAELFWPGDYENSNHEAEERIRERMLREGCEPVRNGMRTGHGTGHTYTGYKTPASDTLVGFDSESGMFECHAADDAPLLYVKTIIDTIKDELDAHREALR